MITGDFDVVTLVSLCAQLLNHRESSALIARRGAGGAQSVDQFYADVRVSVASRGHYPA